MRMLRRVAFAAGLLGTSISTGAAENYADWPVLTNPFPSTGGGGVMIDGYAPVVTDGQCRTPFRALLPDGAVFENRVVFDAIAVDGGTLCANGRWQSADGSAEGTTPLRLFIRDGVVRRNP